MQRCIELAGLGAGSVAPNPLVGAVLVCDNEIIGEGWHQRYGEAHAEVNCINSVSDANRYRIASATLFVSLEPCAHYGKTPPCSDLIIHHRIPRVVVACSDPFPAVDGKGIQKLREAGIAVTEGLLEKEARNLNRRFFCQVEKKRPYIILKWAQTADGFMAGTGNERLLITNEPANRLVHRWRSEEAAILVGTETALRDNPALTNRLWKGRNPVRMVLDRSLRLPSHLALFDQSNKTIVLNTVKQENDAQVQYEKIDATIPLTDAILKAANANGLQSILVEGGAYLLQSFIDSGTWDEIRVITNRQIRIGKGLPAPLFQAHFSEEQQIGSDMIRYYFQTEQTHS